MPMRARVRRWRWGRAVKARDESLRGDRMPVQVCPRGCEYHELARRDLLARTRWHGRAALHTAFEFETTNCPECGARLLRRCARCHHEILAPVRDRCQSCGLPQPWATERRAGTERASIRLWKPPTAGAPADRVAHDPARPLYASTGGTLWVIEGDIARLAVEAVVSNDDVDGQMWAQVARAIKNAAGEGVERAAQEGKPFRVGQAWWTTAGAMDQAGGIIHVASMSRQGESGVNIIREGMTRALRLASERGVASLGVAPIGSGPARIAPSDWYRAFAEVVIGYLGQEPVNDARQRLAIVLVLFEPADFEAEVRSLERIVWDAWAGARRPYGRVELSHLGGFARRAPARLAGGRSELAFEPD
jgi:O-acetyl-ADP-ribose deacetylase (regulator of RNase III)/predicted RNA-binding Zn-ribbon protein involved in translation (DUF1610 family)